MTNHTPKKHGVRKKIRPPEPLVRGRGGGVTEASGPAMVLSDNMLDAKDLTVRPFNEFSALSTSRAYQARIVDESTGLGAGYTFVVRTQVLRQHFQYLPLESRITHNIWRRKLPDGTTQLNDRYFYVKTAFPNTWMYVNMNDRSRDKAPKDWDDIEGRFNSARLLSCGWILIYLP